MFEKRGSVKTATEIRSIVEAMDINKDHNLSFVEWCCAYFKKDFSELNNFVDEAAREAAIKEAMEAGSRAKQVEEEIEKARLNKEIQAQLRAAAIERESKLVRNLHTIACLALDLTPAVISIDRCYGHESFLRSKGGRHSRLHQD